MLCPTWLAIGLVVLQVTQVTTAPPVNELDKPTAAKPSQARQQLAANPQQVRRVQLASQLLAANLRKEDASVGRIDDLAFDLETGHLALMVATKPAGEQTQVFTMLPYRDFREHSKFEWVDERTVAQRPESLTRNQASEVYVTYKRDIYWREYCKKLEESLRQEFDERDFKLTTFSFLSGRPVIDADGERVGKIVDLGINAANGRIVYCVVESPQQELRAIPLGAFVMQEPSYRWVIELPHARITEFEPFSSDNPPTMVDRGWREYVAVRYGRGGLQSVKKANAVK